MRTADGFSPLDFLDAQTSTRLPANASDPHYGSGPEPVLLYVAPVVDAGGPVDRVFAIRTAASEQSDFGPLLRLSSIVNGVELEWTVGGEPLLLWIDHVDSTGTWERIPLIQYGVDLTEGQTSITVPLDRSMAHRFVMTAIYAPGSGLVSNDVTVGTSRRRSVRR